MTIFEMSAAVACYFNSRDGSRVIMGFTKKKKTNFQSCKIPSHSETQGIMYEKLSVVF